MKNPTRKDYWFKLKWTSVCKTVDSVVIELNAGWKGEQCEGKEGKEEDHTLGNMIRHKLTKDPNVIFAGYKNPSPFVNQVIIRVQTTRTMMLSWTPWPTSCPSCPCLRRDSRSSSRRRRRDWIEPDNLFQKKETKCEWLAHAQYVEVTPSRCAPAASPWLTAARSVRRPTGPPTSLSAPSPTQSRRTRQ